MIQRDAHQVDAPGEILEFRVRDEKRLRRVEEASLLGGRHRLFGFYEPAAANLDFDEDEVVASTHYEVQLPGRASPLVREADVPGGLELPAGVLFSRVTTCLARRAH